MFCFRYLGTMVRTHSLGYPRIGPERELKFALERYWRGAMSRDELEAVSIAIDAHTVEQHLQAGMDLVPVGDGSLYDHVLDTSMMLHDLPLRAYETATADEAPIDTYFRVARGRAPQGTPISAGEMTKWFDTNYHYIVPEFSRSDRPAAVPDSLLDRVDRAIALTGGPDRVKPILLGPVTYAYLGKPADLRLSHLSDILPVYREILAELAGRGIEWVQIDEPALVLDLDTAWREAFVDAYNALRPRDVKLLLTTYFGDLGENVGTAAAIGADGYHLDAVSGAASLEHTIAALPPSSVISLGVVDGRNVWRADLSAVLDVIEPLHERWGDRVWIGPSCSLLHTPYDVTQEHDLPPEVRPWLAFARQKLDEIGVLKRALDGGRTTVAAELEESDRVVTARRSSRARMIAAVRKRVRQLASDGHDERVPYEVRAAVQRRDIGLPAFPTTTIGSFPQTAEIRRARREWRAGRASDAEYRQTMKHHISEVIRVQEEIGLDVLVHGEAERNDMVEYFGEHLAGFAFTRHGWVQSYGSRCVKPPIIYGDVDRPEPMTVEWTTYAASCTDRPVKGMLTGPITMLQWSFVRDDQPREDTAMQIAAALRREVLDLEEAGIRLIQVDEPAIREGLPLRRADWDAYLEWAVRAFRTVTAAVNPATQIHTHMCYSEFNDIIESIAAMDADVITIETARSHMELLDAFATFAYPNEIGPGVYDIHSPNVPTVGEMVALLQRAAESIPPDRLWVNPDCGLKTRRWAEVTPSLANMVTAARQLRDAYSA